MSSKAIFLLKELISASIDNSIVLPLVFRGVVKDRFIDFVLKMVQIRTKLSRTHSMILTGTLKENSGS